MLGLSVLLLATACGSAETELDPTLNTDGDCMTDVVEIELGTDPNVDGDADGDGQVSVNDILIVIAQYGVTCP